MGKQKSQKKKKVELVFDPKKRKEYLTGFSKRKQERRQKAKEDLERQVKEERKRVKQEIKDGFQSQFKQSFAPIELEGVLKEEEYETEDVSVQIVELSTDELAKSNHWIGANRPIYSNENNDDAAKEKHNSDDEKQLEDNEVPGFGLKPIKKKNEWKVSEAPIEAINPDAPETQKPTNEKTRTDFKSKRAMGQFLAKKTQSSLKHSKAIQTKNKLERTRNKKKARIEREKRIKLQTKREKHSKKPIKTKKNKKFSKHNSKK